jgi:hypothetical protein
VKRFLLEFLFDEGPFERLRREDAPVLDPAGNSYREHGSERNRDDLLEVVFLVECAKGFLK